MAINYHRKNGVCHLRLCQAAINRVYSCVRLRVVSVQLLFSECAGVGHFFSPLHTFIDTSFLGTVSLPDIRSGVGEIMKAWMNP